MQRKVRQSQTIVPFGVGAIFDLQGESLVACDVFRWGARGEVVHSERLARALGVGGFRSAPAVDSDSRVPARAAGVPYARFPSWLFCSKCRRMFRWRRALEQENRAPTCPSCPGRKQLVPMRWVQICANGHMDDVDWRRWAHSRSGSDEARQCQKDDLYFETVRGGGGGLNTLKVRCGRCKSERTLMGISSKTALKDLHIGCTGRQPWEDWSGRQDCSEFPIAVQRGASNVYFPLVHSSIEIPNPSRADAHSEKAMEIKADAWFRPLLTTSDENPMFERTVELVAQQFEVPTDFVRALVRDEKDRLAGRATAVEATPGDLLSEEWAAFLTPTDESSEDRDFQTRHLGLGALTGESGALLEDRVDKVVVADRIREVRALEGFHRVTPGTRQTLIRAGLNHKVDFLPAIEVRGEGIFLSLDEGRLATWEEEPQVRARVAELEMRLSQSFLASRLRERTGLVLTPRYVLLHTLSHLLIRRLAFESGYAATSLRERIYARNSSDSPSKQAGLLIYTAAGDAEGTLGGLVRQGEPPNFSSTLMQALEDGLWCSSDPLCSENLASTFNSLNFAACHACTLVAETSCESGNYLLDRVLIVGSDTVPGFFQPVMDAAIREAGEGVRGLS